MAMFKVNVWKGYQIAHKKFRDGQVAVTLTNPMSIVPLTIETRLYVKKVIGLYQQGTIIKLNTL